MESCPNLCVRSPWTSTHLTAPSMWSPCLISPRFPVVSLQLTKKAFPQFWSGRTLAEILYLCLCAGLMTCRNNTAFLHSSVLTNIGDTRITQKTFSSKCPWVWAHSPFSVLWPHTELLRSSCSQIIPDADRPRIQCSVLYGACLCWPFPILFLAF